VFLSDLGSKNGRIWTNFVVYGVLWGILRVLEVEIAVLGCENGVWGGGVALEKVEKCKKKLRFLRIL
jgi:hypothetical protein